MSANLVDLERARRAGELLELAALQDGGLRNAFEGVAALLDGEMFQLFNYTRPEAPDMIVSPDRSAVYDEYIAKGWHQLDTWSHRAAKVAQHGRILTDDSVISLEQRRRDTFYQEFCPKWKIGSFTAWTFDLAGEKWAYTLMGRYGGSNRRIDPTVYRHFIEAADRAALLATSRNNMLGQGIAEGLDLAGRPTLVIDHTGRVAFATRSVEKLIGDGFSIRSGRLEGERADTESYFRQLSLRANSSRRHQLHNFLIHRSDGRRPILAMPIDAQDRGLDGLPGARIILMLADLDATPSLDPAALRIAYGFSPRETQLAGRLMAGDSPDEAAKAMEISIHTVRQMLKVMFAKTRTHRQAELVALLARAPVSPQG